MEKTNNSNPNWIPLAKQFAEKIRKSFSDYIDFHNPTDKQNGEYINVFETCEELKFEQIVGWVKSNLDNAKEADCAIIKKSLAKDSEDFKYKLEIFFAKDKTILIEQIHKTYLCKSIEEDLLSDFQDSDFIIIK